MLHSSRKVSFTATMGLEVGSGALPTFSGHAHPFHDQEADAASRSRMDASEYVGQDKIVYGLSLAFTRMRPRERLGSVMV